MRRFLPVAALLVLASCAFGTGPDFIDDEVSGHVIHATIEKGSCPDETKVYADENLRVLWNAGDLITFFNKSAYNYQYRFLGQDGDNGGDFEKISPNVLHTGTELSYNYAVYPYSAATKVSNSGDISLTLPAEQAYRADSFGVGANTMVAVSTDDFLGFRNVCGYFCLRLYGKNRVGRVTLQGRNGEKIAGPAKVTIPLDGVPTVTMGDDATETVSIVCDPPVILDKDAAHYTSFWFVLPPVRFSEGFTVTLEDSDGSVIFSGSMSSDYTVVRNRLDWMEAQKIDAD